MQPSKYATTGLQHIKRIQYFRGAKYSWFSCMTTNILPTNEATLLTFTCSSASSNPKNITHKCLNHEYFVPQKLLAIYSNYGSELQVADSMLCQTLACTLQHAPFSPEQTSKESHPPAPVRAFAHKPQQRRSVELTL